MTILLFLTLIIAVCLACAFGLCEWYVGGRNAAGEGSDSLTMPGRGRSDRSEAAHLAARRRMAERLERDGQGADAE
jgi:hypothetical protein